MSVIVRLGFLSLVCWFAVGCGAGYETASVKGRVTLDGKPLAGGQIVFAPATEGEEELPNAAAIIGPDGTFELEDGAVVGNHKVTVVGEKKMGGPTDEDDEEAEEDESVAASVSSLVATATVDAGENDLLIELTSNGRPYVGLEQKNYTGRRR